MTAARKTLSPAEAWLAAVDMAMSDRARWAESLGDEELDAEIRAMGRDPEVERAKGLAMAAQYGYGAAEAEHAVEAVDASDAEDELARESKRGRVISLIVSRRGARHAPVWLLAASLAAAGVLVAFAVIRRPTIVARQAAPSTDPARTAPPRPAGSPSAPEPFVPVDRTGEERFLKYFSDLDPAVVVGAAQQACAIGEWMWCRMLLDRAEDLDPSYAKSPTVGDLRWRILHNDWVVSHPPPFAPRVSTGPHRP